MSEKQIFALLQRFWKDAEHPEFYWVLLALAVILAVSWWLAYRLRARDREAKPTDQSALQAFGAGSLKRIAFPLIALVLVLILRRVLVQSGYQYLSPLFLAGPLLVSWALARILVYVLRSVFSQGGFLVRSERLLTTFIWGWMVLDVTDLADPVIEQLQRVDFTISKQKIDLWMLIHGSVMVCLTLLLALWIASLIERRLSAAEDMDANVRGVLVRVAKALLLTVALLTSLTLIGIDVTALSVFSGALAVGLGFGLQKIASNYVSGFIILLDRSIRLGNLVSIDAATTGTVTQISTRYTVLNTLGGTDVIIPNEYLVNNIVRNQSFIDTRVRASVAVQVAYDTDLDLAMGLMVDAARQQTRVLADPPPLVLLTEFADSGINLELGFWVADPEAGLGLLRSDISLTIWKSFRAHKVEIPFPQREVRIIGTPANAGAFAE